MAYEAQFKSHLLKKAFLEKHTFCRGASYTTFIMKFIPFVFKLEARDLEFSSVVEPCADVRSNGYIIKIRIPYYFLPIYIAISSGLKIISFISLCGHTTYVKNICTQTLHHLLNKAKCVLPQNHTP